MDNKKLLTFLETLHFHGYIDHDFTKLSDLLQYYPNPENDETINFVVPDHIKQQVKALWNMPNDGTNPRVRAIRLLQTYFFEQEITLSIKSAEKIKNKILKE